jgi:peptidoglycan/xylan/chitin deacetylase (PgdA/CDA1 family)
VTAPPILCYHKVDTRRELGVTRLAPAVFRRQMETLARAGYRTLGSADLLRPEESDQNRTGAEDASPAVVLTFDDGYEPLARHAFPVLADLGFRALVFIVTDYVGRDNDWDVHYGWRRFRHLSWDDLAYWQERGIEVHSHGATHARLTWLSDVQAEDELGRSRATISRRLGASPAGISYPFGAVDSRVQALAATAGYSLGFAGPAGPGGSQPGGAHRLAMRRRPVYAWDAFALPCVMREGAAGAFGMAVARLTNRFAVGTAIIQRFTGARYRVRE